MVEGVIVEGVIAEGATVDSDKENALLSVGVWRSKGICTY